MAKLDAGNKVTREGSGPALVLLHCLGVDRHFWDFAAPLTADFTILRYDLPGHGTSAVPNDSYSIEDLADQLAASEAGFKNPVTGVPVAGTPEIPESKRIANRIDIEKSLLSHPMDDAYYRDRSAQWDKNHRTDADAAND